MGKLPSEMVPDSPILAHRAVNILRELDESRPTLRISSYNILCRHYLWESVYNYLPPEDTSWRHRLERLDRQFQDLSTLSDVMCFQEMEYDVYQTHWKNKFNQIGFKSLFTRKPTPGYWTKGSNMMDGVSIFFNEDIFQLMNFQNVKLSDHFEMDGTFEQTNDTKERLNVRNTVALIAVLKHKITQETIFISNTHLYWSPKHDDVKFMQTYLLTKILKKTIDNYQKTHGEFKQHPLVVMAGDMNSQPDSMVYEFMSTGKLDTGKDPRWLFHYGEGFEKGSIILNPLGCFKSPYKRLYDQGLFTKTTYSKKFKGIIDYMWFNNGSMECAMDLENDIKFTKVLGDIDPDYLKDYEGFPNKDFPSDHIPILVELEL